jgi:hypothetical protein
MKVLLSMLIEKLNHPWWRLRSSEGEPPIEREGQYTFKALRDVIKSRLNRVEDKDASD